MLFCWIAAGWIASLINCEYSLMMCPIFVVRKPLQRWSLRNLNAILLCPLSSDTNFSP